MTVVTDTSVILNLCWLGQEELLSKLFGCVIAPPEVRHEFERLALSDPRFVGLSFPNWIEVVPVSGIAAVLAGEVGLDPGELAALSLALERRIADVLLDERAARAVAVSLALRPCGLLGVLVKAKAGGWLPAVVPLVDRLRGNAGFWISEELREQIARLTGE